MFPSLKELKIRGCHSLQHIFPASFAGGLVKLKYIDIDQTPELKYLFGPSSFEERSCHRHQNKIQIDLPILEKLHLKGIRNLISICPDSYCVAFSSLLQLSWICVELSAINCSMVASEALCNYGSKKELAALVMDSNQIINKTALWQAFQNVEKIFVSQSELEGIVQLPGELAIATNRKPVPLTSYLRTLVLTNLPKLMYICKGPVHSIGLQYLEAVELNACHNLTCIFSSCIARGLPRLKELRIASCGKLERIFEEEENQEFSDLPMVSCQVENCPKNTSNASVKLQIAGPFNLCNLKKLLIESCWMLRSLFSPSIAICLTSLEELEIKECYGLRRLVTCNKSHKNKGEIMQEDYDSQSYISMFPRLRRIHVKQCNLLEYILPVYFAQGLVELKYIRIEHTSTLRYIFGQSIDEVHSSHACQNQIQIELSSLEEFHLDGVPYMVRTCPDNYHVTCPSLRRLTMKNVRLATLALYANNLMVDLATTHFGHSSTTDTGIANMMNGQTLETVDKIKGNFCVVESPIKGQVTPSLQYLALLRLPMLTDIWVGAKHFLNLQHLNELNICGCSKLKAVFSASVLRSLPLLEILAVKECEKLEQIIEEDEENENVSNLQSPKICFPQLKLLLVTHCNSLKRLFIISPSHEFPKLQYLILSQDSHLEEVFEGREGAIEGRLEVLLPELKHVILMQLPNLTNICQQIDFQTAANLFVHKCPKLSLTSTTTSEVMLQDYDSDDKIEYYVHRELRGIRDSMREETARKDTMLTSQLQMNPKDEASVNEYNQTESIAITLESENIGPQGLQQLEHQPSSIPSPNLTEGIEEDRVKENVQEGIMSKEAMKSTLLAGLEGVSLGGGVVTNVLAQDSQVVDTRTSQCQKIRSGNDSIVSKEGEIGVVSNDRIEASPGGSADTCRSHSLIIAKLEEFKQFVDLDDAQIALLLEAIAVYPHLWKVCETFRPEFQAFMFKTLAEMLFFLRNESAVSVAPEREKEFQRICNEAVQLGFQRSWVDEMRQRVMVRDPGVDNAQARISELFKRHDQLTLELGKIKDEINSLNDFVVAKKKCFDFL